jgi:hypothetical protein
MPPPRIAPAYTTRLPPSVRAVGPTDRIRVEYYRAETLLDGVLEGGLALGAALYAGLMRKARSRRCYHQFK